LYNTYNMKSTPALHIWIRYCLVVFATLFLTVALFFVISSLGASNSLSVLLTMLIALPASFIGHSLWTFTRPDKYAIWPILQRFGLFLVIFFLNIAAGLMIASVTPVAILPYVLGAFTAVALVVNYYPLRWIFLLKLSQKPSLSSAQIKRKIGIGLLLCLPIIAFSFGLLQSGQKIIPGDPDYYLQIYEAFRRSILEFNQLPFWNGWVGGGIPLFANIQFGFISVQAPLILLFGTVMGMKIAIVAYQIIGYFGFKKLFEKGFKTAPLRAALLAYIPIFGSFFVDRVVAGHYTFLLIAFVPWLILFYIQRKQQFNWLCFALIYSFMVWSSPHYITIMAMLVIGIWFFFEKIQALVLSTKQKLYKKFFINLKQDLLFFAKAGTAIIALCFYRMFFVVDFIKDFPRDDPVTNESFTGIKTGLYAIWGPDQYANPPALPSGWGWTEAATYIGVGTLLCLIIILGVYVFSIIKKRANTFSYSPTLLGVLLIAFFILGMGDFGPYSPYTLLGNLPIFDSMRVATRWLLWASLFALFIIATYKDKILKKTINIILAITVVELFIIGSKVIGTAYFIEVQQYRPSDAFFGQEYKYNLPRPNYSSDQNYLKNYFYDENLYETTRNNLGQVIVGDSLVDTRQPNTTIRCGENQFGCQLISANARIAYWSPNKIIIERIADGPISVNMNPGKGWLVNGKYTYLEEKITEPQKAFVIEDTSQTVMLEYAPKLSPAWFKTSLWP